MGGAEGEDVGALVGEAVVGEDEGVSLGANVGAVEGESVGELVGASLGAEVGAVDGESVEVWD